MPSPEAPLRGSCACGTVRFQVTADFVYRRVLPLHPLPAPRGNAVDDERDGPRVGRRGARGRGLGPLSGAPPDGLPEGVLRDCGGHVLSGEPGAGGVVGVRFGALHGDPGIEPRWRQWLSSAPDWAPIPDDGLPRFPEKREID